MSTVTMALAGPSQAHQCFEEVWRLHAKPHALAGGMAVVTWTTHDAYWRHQQRKHFHGHALNTVSDQVRVWCPDERRYTRRHPQAWKNYSRMFIPPSFEDLVDPDGKPLVKERRRSTERMSDDQFADFAQEFMGHAALDLGVNFEGDF